MKTANPLRLIPPADVIRRRLTETESEAAKLRILLEVSERIESVDHDTATEAPRREVANAS